MWGTEDHSSSVENLRLREAVSHKKNIMTEVRKGKEIDDIKPRNRSMGQIMQNKIGEVMKKNLSKRPIKKNTRKNTDEDKCWDLHNKVSRINRTEPSMLTSVGKEFLKVAKNGFKNHEDIQSFKFPLKMCELSLAHVESDEEIRKEEIDHILKVWNGFEIDPNRTEINGSNFPRL